MLYTFVLINVNKFIKKHAVKNTRSIVSQDMAENCRFVGLATADFLVIFTYRVRDRSTKFISVSAFG